MQRDKLAQIVRIAETLDEHDMEAWDTCALGLAVEDHILEMPTNYGGHAAFYTSRIAGFAEQLGLDPYDVERIFGGNMSGLECASEIRQLLRSPVTSDARKICRAFDAADERDSTEIGI